MIECIEVESFIDYFDIMTECIEIGNDIALYETFGTLATYHGYPISYETEFSFENSLINRDTI